MSFEIGVYIGASFNASLTWSLPTHQSITLSLCSSLIRWQSSLPTRVLAHLTGS